MISTPTLGQFHQHFLNNFFANTFDHFMLNFLVYSTELQG
jgi:hypothetical protein